MKITIECELDDLEAMLKAVGETPARIRRVSMEHEFVPTWPP